jgi:HIV-1 Vpr-binding protein
VTLDGIVTQFLRDQHRRCAHPVAAVPPFSLFDEHRCLEPRYYDRAPANIAARVLARQTAPPYGMSDSEGCCKRALMLLGGLYGPSLDRKFFYSRFRSVRHVRAGMSPCL